MHRPATASRRADLTAEGGQPQIHTPHAHRVVGPFEVKVAAMGTVGIDVDRAALRAPEPPQPRKSARLRSIS